MKRHSLLSLVAAVGGLLLASSLHAALADSPETVHPLAKGVVAPSAVIQTAEGKDAEFAAVIKDKPTILIFYRGGWCPLCNRQLAALGQSYLELRKLGYQIVGVTPDNLAALAATAEEHHLLYQLFSDRAMRLSDKFGVAYRISAETAAGYKKNGIDLAPTPTGGDYWLPLPSAFVIGRDGAIKFVYYNSDTTVRISSEDLIAAATAALDRTPSQ